MNNGYKTNTLICINDILEEFWNTFDILDKKNMKNILAEMPSVAPVKCYKHVKKKFWTLKKKNFEGRGVSSKNVSQIGSGVWPVIAAIAIWEKSFII